MKIHTDPQRSEAWHARRRGIPTASEFDRIITPQGKRSGQAKRYMYELAYEQITGKSTAKDLSNIVHVQHGVANEATAVQAFEQYSGLSTQEIGFLTNDTETIGCSPDRLILGRHEALEIKCPTGPIQVGYLIDGLDSYKAQLQGQILIGGFRCIHFYSWSSELPPYYEIIPPNPEFLVLLEKYLAEFHQELTRGVAHIRAMGSWPRNALSVFPDDGPDEAA